MFKRITSLAFVFLHLYEYFKFKSQHYVEYHHRWRRTKNKIKNSNYRQYFISSVRDISLYSFHTLQFFVFFESHPRISTAHKEPYWLKNSLINKTGCLSCLYVILSTGSPQCGLFVFMFNAIIFFLETTIA